MEDTVKKLREKAMRLPLHPGVYIMKDKSGRVIYVGKSKALKNRVSQYFSESRHDMKTSKMVSCVEDFDYMLTDNNMEALTLENRLIKLHLPKFNIKLKDGKSYPYIKITVGEAYPRIFAVRKREADGAVYFGPYTGIRAAYAIIKTLQKTFGIAACGKEFPRDIGKGRPCLNAHIGQCSAPCSGKVSSEQYHEIYKDIISFFKGSYSEITKTLESRMLEASENMRYEAAAALRDRLSAVRRMKQHQKVVGKPDTELDVMALYTGADCSCLMVLYVRDGCLIDSESIVFPAEAPTDGDSLTSFVFDLYMKREYVPHELLMNFDIGDDNSEALSECLGEKAQKKVTLRVPQRGDDKALCDMAYENAAEKAKQYAAENETSNRALAKLAELLSLEKIPERIESYDISNFGDDNITAGKIVCEQGKFKKSDYRTYKIRSTETQNDYGAMREAVARRLSHDEDIYPDLILLDGGAAHVSVISELMSQLGCDVPVFGMVKDSYHKTRALVGQEGEISIAKEQAVFSLISRIQDEVHRYTVGRMTAAKSKSLKKTELTGISGIGEAKARALLSHFGSISEIAAANEAELCAVRGISGVNAAAVAGYFKQKKKYSED